MGFAENVVQGREKQFSRGMQGNVHRHAFHRSSTSLGAAGHFIHLATVGAPLIIGELVTDADKRWRYSRLATFGTALASEAVWTFKVAHDRHKENQLRDELESCGQR